MAFVIDRFEGNAWRRAATYVDRILCGACGRSPGAAADQVRDGREPQERHGARPCETPIDFAAR